MRAISRCLLIAALVASTAVSPLAANAGWKEIGVRAGANATGSVTINEYELFAGYQLPWGGGSETGWRLGTRANGSLGMLQGSGDVGFIGSIGPGLSLERAHLPLELEGGVRAALLSRDTFGGKDLNGQVQFISHIGLNLRIIQSLGIGYNFQHMSNANMNGTKNPGVNMHMLSLHYYFGP